MITWFKNLFRPASASFTESARVEPVKPVAKSTRTKTTTTRKTTTKKPSPKK